MSATAVDAILIPRPRIHEWFDEKAESVRFVQLELPEQLAEWFGLAPTTHQVFEPIAHLVLQEPLDAGEIEEIADRICSATGFEQVAYRGAVWVPAR